MKRTAEFAVFQFQARQPLFGICQFIACGLALHQHPGQHPAFHTTRCPNPRVAGFLVDFQNFQRCATGQHAQDSELGTLAGTHLDIQAIADVTGFCRGSCDQSEEQDKNKGNRFHKQLLVIPASVKQGAHCNGIGRDSIMVVKLPRDTL